MLLTPEEARGYERNREIIYRYSKKIRELNDGETEFWIEDFDLNLLTSGCEFENGEVIIHSAGALIRISLEKENIVCDGKESHNRIISWSCDGVTRTYQLNQGTKAKKHVIL